MNTAPMRRVSLCMTEQIERLSTVLREARTALGFTLRDMPRKMVVSVVRWGEYERGVAVPSLAELEVIAPMLGLDYQRLLALRAGTAAQLEDLILQAGRMLYPQVASLVEVAARLLSAQLDDAPPLAQEWARRSGFEDLVRQIGDRVRAAEADALVERSLHPTGHCSCAGEARCDWCRRAASAEA